VVPKLLTGVMTEMTEAYTSATIYSNIRLCQR